MTETFNGSIIEARYKPIVTMLDDIYMSVMTRIARRKAWAESIEQAICPRILGKLEKAEEDSKFWRAYGSGGGFYNVKHGIEAYIVNLNMKICS